MRPSPDCRPAVGAYGPQGHVSWAQHARRTSRACRLKRNFHRAAGRILCRRLKYATGYFPTLVKIFPRQPPLIPDVYIASLPIHSFCYADKGESHAL
ncbi:hypothetical protein V6N13_007102 [Hibiscus sabdariffa]